MLLDKAPQVGHSRVSELLLKMILLPIRQNDSLVFICFVSSGHCQYSPKSKGWYDSFFFYFFYSSTNIY